MSSTEQGPAMICATPVMRSGPTRIGRLGAITFPRTIPVVTLLAAGAGALVGMALAATLGHGFSALLYGAVFGGAAGWFAVNYSPLQGESLLKWFELQFHATRRGRYLEGERVTLAVGTAVLQRPPRGRVRLVRGAVHVPSTQYDERGVLISAKNKNLPADGEIDPLLFAALGLPGEGATSLTPVEGLSMGAPAGRRATRGNGHKQGSSTASSTDPSRVEVAVRPPKPQRLKD